MVHHQLFDNFLVGLNLVFILIYPYMSPKIKLYFVK